MAQAASHVFSITLMIFYKWVDAPALDLRCLYTSQSYEKTGMPHPMEDRKNQEDFLSDSPGL